MTTDKPNILVIWGDDIGWQNLSCYGLGTMGYTTPNIDRIANEGALFSQHYGEPSCTPGRAAFITGQYPIRSGMVRVGMPGDELGLQPASPCLAEVLKAHGYATGQFGKNHLGDLNKHLPTMHGFDEFFGFLYHLNTQEQFEQRDYENFAKEYSGSLEAFEAKFGTRGVLDCKATDIDDESVDSRFGKVGMQTIVDTGPLTQERMMNFDDGEIIPRAKDYMKRQKDNGKPFFVWLNTSRMHLYTRLNDEWRYAAEQYTTEADFHGSGMLQHDHDIKDVLDFLDAEGLTENTIVWYSTDNGPEHSSWPHGATTPFRGEKMTTFEGGIRLPSMLRWPGKVKERSILNGMQHHSDMFVTLARAAGIEDVADEVLSAKNQLLDGVDNLEYWTGEQGESARRVLFHYTEAKLTAARMGPWKFHFSTAENYYDRMTPRGKPLVFNIPLDPNESYDTIDSYGHLVQKVSWLLAPMKELMGQHLSTLVKHPPVQGGQSFDMSNVVEQFLSAGHE